jgi:hypothetical protein
MNRAPQRLIPLLGAVLAVASLMAPEKAHAVCSVLSRHPCTPYSCGVFGGPCSPQVVLLVGNVPVLKVAGHAGPPAPVDRDHPLDRLDEIAPLLSKCLEPPPDGESQTGMELALRFAFKRNGELLADPRFTYTTHGAPEHMKAAWHAAALEMLRRCAPLPITEKLGGAIAGRPLVVAIRETRDLKHGSHSGDAAPDPPAGAKP